MSNTNFRQWSVPTIVRAMIVLFTFDCMNVTADENERKYPAAISVVSHRINDKGHLVIKTRLSIDDHVAIYANPVRAPGMDHASARVTVFDANGQPLRAQVTYPKGEKLETELGDWYLYRKSVDIDVVLPNNPPLPLILRAKVAGYNEQKAACLGFGSLETKLRTQQEKAKPNDTAKSQ